MRQNVADFIKTVGKLILTVIIAGVAGFMFMWFTMSLDTEPMRENVKELAATKAGNVHPYFIDVSTMVDFETDGLIFEMAVYDDGETSFDRAIRVPKAIYHKLPDDAVGTYVCDEFKQLDAYVNEKPYIYTREIQDEELSDSDTYTRYDYSRYWHGTTGVVKILLRLFSGDTVYTVMALLLLLGLLLFTLEINKSDRRLTYLPFGFLIITSPISTLMCIQYLQVSITTVWLGYVLCKTHNKQIKKDWTIVFFCAAGCIMNFFDLLTYPVAGAMAILFVGAAIRDWKLPEIVKHTIAWFCGYFGMWAVKLVLSVLYDKSLLKRTLLHIFERSTVSGAGDVARRNYNLLDLETNSSMELTRLNTILYNFEYVFKTVNIIAVVLVVMLVAIAIIRNRHDKVRQNISILTIPSLSVLWYCVFTSHSAVHAWFTWRNAAVSVLLLLIYLRICFGNKKEQQLEVRDA